MKKYISPAIFILILVASLLLTYKVISWKDTKGTPGSSITQLANLDDNTVDMVFVGSSHVYCGIMPAVLWRDYGIASFDLAISGMDKDSAYYAIKHMLKTQSPKYVCVDMYALNYDTHGILGNEYRNMLSLPYSKEQYSLVLDYCGEKNSDYLLKWPVIHTRYKELQKEDFYDDIFAKSGKGEHITFHKTGYPVAIQNQSLITDVSELGEKNIKWLDRLVDLSKEYDFELIFFVAPFEQGEQPQKIMNAAYYYAFDNGIPFYDFTKLSGFLNLDYANDFTDDTHLNTLGAEKLTGWFGKNFIADLTDHRGEKGYESWDLDLLKYNHDNTVYFYSIIAETGTMEERLELLASMSDVVIFTSLNGSWQESTAPILDYLSILGIWDTDISGDSVWIGNNLNMQKYFEELSGEPVYYKLSRYHEAKLTHGSDKLDAVNIDGTNFQKVVNGMTVIAWDTVNEEVIDAIGIY